MFRGRRARLEGSGSGGRRSDAASASSIVILPASADSGRRRALDLAQVGPTLPTRWWRKCWQLFKLLPQVESAPKSSQRPSPGTRLEPLRPARSERDFSFRSRAHSANSSARVSVLHQLRSSAKALASARGLGRLLEGLTGAARPRAPPSSSINPLTLCSRGINLRGARRRAATGRSATVGAARSSPLLRARREAPPRRLSSQAGLGSFTRKQRRGRRSGSGNATARRPPPSRAGRPK